MRATGRLVPTNYDHVESYGLNLQDHTPAIQPVAPGVNWYTGFDSPVQGSDGLWRVPSKKLGTIRGGHCICLVPPSLLERDTEAFHRFFNQGKEGACEGFGHARRDAIVFGQTFDAFHLYDDGQRIEGTYDRFVSTDEGTTNDAVCQAMKKWGVHPQDGEVAHRANVATEPHPRAESAYRWATTADQILAVLGITDGGEIPFKNSWGDDYPFTTYMDPSVLERLLREGGEADVLTDK